MWMKFKLWFIKRFFRVGLWWWIKWSKIYRFLFHRKYKKKIKLYKNLTPDRANSFMKYITWTKDGTKELWDSCGSPYWVQHCIQQLLLKNPQPLGALDCDDFSIWAANVVDTEYNPRIFSFVWIGATNDPSQGRNKQKMRGHAMCLLRRPNGKLFHIGNWGKSEDFNNLKEHCEDIIRRTNAEEAIGWALFDKDLQLLTYGRNLPKVDVF